MKTLFVLRHSKAGQANKNLLDDHERGLTTKGERLCRIIADDLKRSKARPDVVLSSTARRCVETYEQIKLAYDVDCPLETSSPLYLADSLEVLRETRKLSNEYSSALLVGHNPGLHEFAIQITARASDRKLQRNLKNQFSPPTLVKFELPINEWKNLVFDSGILVHYFRAVEKRT